MKKVVIVLTTIVTMVSCKKETVVIATSPVPAKYLVKSTYVWDNGTPEINTYTYDGQGHLAAYSNGNFKRTFNYQSATQLLVSEISLPANTPKQTIECTLNSAGAVTVAVYKNNTGTVVYTYSYVYDADGHIISEKGQYAANNYFENFFVWKEGNLVSGKKYDNGVHTSNRQYFYDNNKLNTAGQISAGLFMSKTLFGKQSKNHIAELKIVDLNDKLIWHTTSNYQLDAAGYPVKDVYTNVLQGKMGITEYVYQ